MIAAALAAVTVLTRGDQASAPPQTAPASAPPLPAHWTGSVPPVTGTAVGCGPGAVDAAAVLAGPRPPATGEHAVAVFEAAYYHARDARLAREVVAPDAAIPAAAEIQAGIDTVPPGTAYCARVRALAPGLSAVEVTEIRPGQPETVWRQRVSTTHVNGRAVITAITPA